MRKVQLLPQVPFWDLEGAGGAAAGLSHPRARPGCHRPSALYSNPTNPTAFTPPAAAGGGCAARKGNLAALCHPNSSSCSSLKPFTLYTPPCTPTPQAAPCTPYPVTPLYQPLAPPYPKNTPFTSYPHSPSYPYTPCTPHTTPCTHCPLNSLEATPYTPQTTP